MQICNRNKYQDPMNYVAKNKLKLCVRCDILRREINMLIHNVNNYET
jgi:hypothetical protein